MIVDAKDQIVGRLGAIVAKKAILGEKIDIVNAEQAVISGKRAEILAKWKQRAARTTWSKGPHFQRNPDRLLKRMIRDMLPYKQAKGRTAFENIQCWIGVPSQFEGKETTSFKEASADKLMVKSVSVKEISRFLGGNVD